MPENNPIYGSTQESLFIASCRSGTPLASKVVDLYETSNKLEDIKHEVRFLKDIDFQFSDGETCVRLEKDVNGQDVFLFQALQDPTSNRRVDENYMAFLFAIRAFQEWGANRVTGVLPYLAYARQDKPTAGEREPITAQLMAELSIMAGLDRLITWAPHDGQVHGFYGRVPVKGMKAVSLFENEFKFLKGKRDLIGVAPDSGAAALMLPFCKKMDIRCAITSKFRPEPEKAAITEIMGNFDNMQNAIVLDDMINTGGTIEAVIKKLVMDKGIEKVWLGVSHFLGNPHAIRRLKELHADFGLQSVLVTDSVPLTQPFLDLDFTKVVSLDRFIVKTIRRIYMNQAMNAF